jgi:hypothetical protein
MNWKPHDWIEHASFGLGYAPLLVAMQESVQPVLNSHFQRFLLGIVVGVQSVTQRIP